MSEIRRYRRFKGWDYSKGASLFITIATEPRRRLFGEVKGGKMELSPLGKIVAEALEAMPRLNGGLFLFGHVVMPDHIHFNCALAPGLKEPLKVLGGAIRRFKNYTTAMAKRSLAINSAAASPKDQAGFEGHLWRVDSPDGFAPAASPVPDIRSAPSHDGRTAFGHIWQQGYHDYLLVSRGMIDSTERYIAYNPPKWELMYGAGGGMRVIEPISSPRLDVGDYWKGVGNVDLLSPSHKLVSLRVSREVVSPAAIRQLVRRMETAVEKGYVIISGFISKGERAVKDMLCRRKGTRFIRILPSCIPNRRFKPESAYIQPFAENRYLESGRGNDETEFGRPACLDLNAEIIQIATSCEGIAIYWKADGPHVLARNG